ncbi:14126_t:CDS:2 [Funneliformis mosseae]|uniref:14126_t:CDS:1 n=1 Tax=Funneliformis mosseae TaxID=27381 RepID=A0A9N9A750_FUNMO|nr:14126_t:CDS:2 [Funneliformis mosseae]
MEKLSDKIIEEIKDFEYDNLTDEQESLINRLILNENLKKCYKEYGLCEECQQPNTGSEWCQSCKAKNLDDKNSVFNKQSKEADESNKKLSAISSTEDHPMYKAHPQAVYISRPLNFNKLPETKNANNVEFEAGYSEKGKVNVTNASSNPRFSSPVSSSPRIRTESNPQQTNIKDHENWVAKQQERISILQKNVELQKHLRELSLNNDDHEKWMEQQQQRIDIYQRQIEFQKQLNELYLAIPQLTNDEEYEKWMERQQERIRVLKEQVELQQHPYSLSAAFR